MGRVALGVLLAVAVLPLVLICWLRFGHAPVAVADKPFPMEQWLASMARDARVHAGSPKKLQTEADEKNLVAGAHIYHDHCASCHGYHGHPSEAGSHMYPMAPQLWEKHGKDVVGVSDDPATATFWKVSNGIRLTGMPAYKDVLTETEVEQVSLLLANADKALPPDAIGILLQLKPDTPALPELPALPQPDGH
ncbi:c-type cytochrome [Telmatobacter bradus]|uniref:c-type cytochrome n=1 Tax=Telmatobacter bradus TaxID=474953 RepID=UPI003B436100